MHLFRPNHVARSSASACAETFILSTFHMQARNTCNRYSKNISEKVEYTVNADVETRRTKGNFIHQGHNDPLSTPSMDRSLSVYNLLSSHRQ
ncbi:hypothetical protein J6590_084133 [Homalodisca vitripennis]|nr:hypothetical protein J6590_097425 [Homalodisca vitripennis]KAG8265878.1 hypothetical protein J6590_084133 [Homalodisca vitripennis]